MVLCDSYVKDSTPNFLQGCHLLFHGLVLPPIPRSHGKKNNARREEIFTAVPEGHGVKQKGQLQDEALSVFFVRNNLMIMNLWLVVCFAYVLFSTLKDWGKMNPI